MTVIVALQGSASGDGFLIAPLGAHVFPARARRCRRTRDGSVTLRGVSRRRPAWCSPRRRAALTTEPTVVDVHATAKSVSRGDTTIEVLEGDTVVWRMAVTCIANPVVVHFRGRFQARFATQPAFYNTNPTYTATSENVGPGWTWGLEGEPDFVPATGNVPGADRDASRSADPLQRPRRPPVPCGAGRDGRRPDQRATRTGPERSPAATPPLARG